MTSMTPVDLTHSSAGDASYPPASCPSCPPTSCPPTSCPSVPPVQSLSCPSCPPITVLSCSSCPATGSHALYVVFGVLLGVLIGVAGVAGVGYLLFRQKKWPFSAAAEERIVSSLRFRNQIEDDEEIYGDDGL